MLALALALLLTAARDGNASLAAPSKPPALEHGGWRIETVDSAGDPAIWTSLALDAAGIPHIAYYLNAGKYAYRNASGWHSTTFDDMGMDSSLALGSDGYPRIAYRKLNQMNYAYQDASGWHSQFIYGYVNSYSYCSLALDEEGYPHFSFYDELRVVLDPVIGHLGYAYQDGAGWHTEQVPDDTLTFRGLYSSIAVDGEGYTHISYFHASRQDLKYAYQDGSGWHIETVDSEGLVGAHTSLALDDNGYPHISYFYCGETSYPQCDAYDLKYAYRDTRGWHIETVDSAGEAGTYTSLEIDRDGFPHISYWDYGNNDLKYAYQDAAGWQIQTVDGQGEDVGQYSSLALGRDGSVHIGYGDDSNGSLKYAYLESASPEPKPIYLPVLLKGG